MAAKISQYLFYPGMLLSSWVLFFGLKSLFKSDDLFFLVAILSTGAIVIIHVLEKFFPYRRIWNQSRGDRVSNLLLTNVLLPGISRLAEVVLGWLALSMVPDSHQFLRNQWPHQWPLMLQLLLALLICEFFFYWIHRISHRTQFFWNFHRAHHTVKRVYWENSGRFHPVDLFLNWFFYFWPLIFFGVSQELMALFLLTNGVTGLLEHANINYRGGVLNRVFNTAELHRWHHSTVIEESSTNFGKVLCVWDQIFGSYYLPADREVGDTGVIDEDSHLETYWAELALPFKRLIRPRK
jgi:sterol desaturase/sphingolipid hydroxylase (fatty acid hydroxylase superfamily)